MMHSSRYLRFVFTSFFLLLFSCLWAENFRVHQTVDIVLSSIQDTVTVEAGIYDAVAIRIPEDMTFVEGLELNIKIPDDVASWHDSVIYTFYNNVEPAPSSAVIDYTGDKLETDTIPGKLSLNLAVPLKRNAAKKADPYTKTLSRIPNIKNNTVFLRFQLAMKGVPQSFETTKFTITAKSVLSDKGLLNLKLITPKKEDADTCAIYIDEKPVKSDAFPVILDTGSHHLSIISDNFRSETRTFIIEKTQTTALEIPMRGIEPLLNISCPENAVVYIDDVKTDRNQGTIKLTQGEHRIKFTIGDYEIVRVFNAVNGKTYTVPLNIEAGLIEED